MGFFDFLKTAEKDVKGAWNFLNKPLNQFTPVQRVQQTYDKIVPNDQVLRKEAINIAQSVPRGFDTVLRSAAQPFTSTDLTRAPATDTFSKALFGSQPIETYQKRQAGNVAKGIPTPLAFLGTALNAAGDITGVSALEKKASQDIAEQLVKAATVSEAKKILAKKYAPDVVERIAPAVARATDSGAIKNIINDAVKPTGSLVNDVRPAVTAPPPGEGNLITKLVDALHGQPAAPGQSPIAGIENLQSKQKGLYSAERSARLGQATAIDTTSMTGRESLQAQKGALGGGPLPRVDATNLSERLRSKIAPEDLDGILKIINSHPALQHYTAINLQDGLVKMYEDGKLLQPKQWENLEKVSPELAGALKTTAIDSMSKWDVFKNYATQGLGLPKALLATFDLSGIGRQGFALGTRFPGHLANAAKEAAKGFVSTNYYDKKVAEMAARPNSPLYDAWELQVISRGKHAEQFSTQLAEKIPGVKQADHGYNLGLSTERADVLDDIVQNLKDVGFKVGQKSTLGIKHGGTLTKDFNQFPDSYGKSLAKYINTFSGVGTGKKGGWFEKYAPALGQTLFSPRLWKSRLDMLNPVFYAKLDGPAQKLALQNAGSFAAVVASVLGLAAKAGAQVETDPRSSDFLKIKVGDTRYDILGGLQQNLVFAHRQLPGSIFGHKTYIGSGEKKNSITGDVTSLTKGGPLSPSRLSVLEDLIQNKENPVISTGQNILRGKDKAGNPINLANLNPFSNEITKTLIPLNIQDTYQAIKNTGSVPKGLLKATIPGTLGVGVGTYGIKDLKPTGTQQKYLDKLKSKGAPNDQVDASTSFYQYLKAAPNRSSVTDAMKQSILKTGDVNEAVKLAQGYNDKFNASLYNWSDKYGKYAQDEQLVKDYTSKLISDDTLNAMVRAIEKEQQ